MDTDAPGEGTIPEGTIPEGTIPEGEPRHFGSGTHGADKPTNLHAGPHGWNPWRLAILGRQHSFVFRRRQHLARQPANVAREGGRAGGGVL